MVDGGKVWEMTLPTCFDELSAAQFEAVVGASQDLAGQQQLWKAMGVSPSLLEVLPVWVQTQVCHILDFLSDQDAAIDHFIIESVPGPDRFCRLVAPSPQLDGVSLQQFMTIDSFFSFYLSTKNEEFLGKMLASVYLKKGEGFVRDDDHPKLVPIEKRAAFFQDNKTLKDCTLLNWLMIRNWLSSVFKNLFQRSAVEEPSSEGGQGTDWLGLFDSFVGDNIPFMEAYQKMECMDAFRIIDRKIKEQRKNALR